MSDRFMGSCWGVVDRASMSHSKGHMCFPSTWRKGDSCLSLLLGHLSNVSFLLDVWGCDLCKERLWKRLRWSQPPSSIPPSLSESSSKACCMYVSAVSAHRKEWDLPVPNSDRNNQTSIFIPSQMAKGCVLLETMTGDGHQPLWTCSLLCGELVLSLITDLDAALACLKCWVASLHLEPSHLT